MADKKISQLVDGGTPQATDEFVIDRGGTDNFKIDYASLEAASLAGAVILAPASDARNVIEPTAGTVIPITIRGAAGQSDALLVIEDSALADLVSVGPTGAVTISPSDADAYRLYMTDTGQIYGAFFESENNGWTVSNYVSDGGRFRVSGSDINNEYPIFLGRLTGTTPQIGFFGATPAAQPAAPTTMNEVVTALQTLGLTA